MFSRLCRVSIFAAAASLALVSSAAAQTGRVGGTVKDEAGQPIKGATVTAENGSASPSSFTATTDDKGRFGMIGLRTGQWAFTVQAPGFVADGLRMDVRTVGAPNPPIEVKLKKAAAPPPSALGNTAPKDLQQELLSADALYNAQQWDQAITAYRAILERTPALTVINLQIAAAYRNKRDYDKAIAAYSDLLKSDPNNDRAKIGIGMTNLEKGDIAGAEAALTQAAEGLSPTREVFYNLGEVKFAKGDADEAAKWYEKAVALDPNWGKPLLKLALVQLNKGDKDATIKSLERVIAADPTSPEATQAKAVIEQLRK
jgi:predicted Zn-dependent protease